MTLVWTTTGVTTWIRAPRMYPPAEAQGPLLLVVPESTPRPEIV